MSTRYLCTTGVKPASDVTFSICVPRPKRIQNTRDLIRACHTHIHTHTHTHTYTYRHAVRCQRIVECLGKMRYPKAGDKKSSTTRDDDVLLLTYVTYTKRKRNIPYLDRMFSPRIRQCVNCVRTSAAASRKAFFHHRSRLRSRGIARVPGGCRIHREISRVLFRLTGTLKSLLTATR